MLELTGIMKEFTGMTAVTLAFLVASIAVVMNNRTVDRLSRRVFIDSLMALFALALIDWFAYVTSGAFPELITTHTILMALTFCIAPCIPVAIADAIFPAKNLKIIRVLLVIHAIFQIGGIFGGYVFWIDDSNVYHRGQLYFIYMLVYVVSLLYLVIESVRMGQAYQSSIAAIVSVLVCLLVGVSIQLFDGMIRTTWLSVSMTVMLFFAYYSDMVLRAEPLTKLLNRLSYEEFIAKPKLPCVAVVVDVNDFKHVNDTYGHAYGDECLVRIASLIRKSFGAVGLCYRTGGDEFAVFVTKRLADVDTFATALKDAVAQAQGEDNRLPGVSIGYAVADAHCADFEAVISAADMSMYEAKRLEKSSS